MPAEKGGRETRLTIVTRADESRMNSVLVSITVATSISSMSTFKVKWLLNDSRNNTTRVWEHRFHRPDGPVTPSSPGETAARDNVEFPIESIPWPKGQSQFQ
jgi:hypothetical protein